MKDLQLKGAIEPASSEPGFYSLLFVTLKVTGDWRPVIDLSRVNRFVQLSHFRMETSLSVLQSLRPRDWMISIDLQDAYLQDPVHPDSRRYLWFCIDEQTFQFRVLCFRLSSASQVFTCVMAPVSSIMHRFRYRILCYLDDWLVLGSSLQEITWARDFLLWLCSELGVPVNLSKISYTCSDSGLPRHDSPVFSNPSSDAESSLSRRRVLLLARAAAQSLAVYVGSHVIAVHSHSRVSSSHAVFATPSQRVGPSVVGGRADLLGRLLPPGSSVVVHCQPSRGRSLPRVAPTPAASLQWRFGHELGCVARRRPPVRLVVSECFDVFDQPPRTPGHVGNPWLPPSPPRPLGVALHRQHDGALLPAEGRGHTLVYPQCGGPSYPSPLQGQRCSSAPPVCTRAPQRPCDPLSRGSQVLGSERTLCMDICWELFCRWPVTVDLFATSLNHWLQVYFSPVADYQAAGIDAMLQSWGHLQAYAFPPFGFIQRVLTKVRQSRNLEVTLVAPFWPLKPWFPDLLELLV